MRAFVCDMIQICGRSWNLLMDKKETEWKNVNSQDFFFFFFCLTLFRNHWPNTHVSFVSPFSHTMPDEYPILLGTGEPHPSLWTDRHLWKHYLPASLRNASVNQSELDILPTGYRSVKSKRMCRYGPVTSQLVAWNNVVRFKNKAWLPKMNPFERLLCVHGTNNRSMRTILSSMTNQQCLQFRILVS